MKMRRPLYEAFKWPPGEVSGCWRPFPETLPRVIVMVNPIDLLVWFNRDPVHIEFLDEPINDFINSIQFAFFYVKVYSGFPKRGWLT